MADSRAQKRSAAGSSSPLLDRGILQYVLTFIGPGHYLFVALVSTWWKELYATQERQQLSVIDEECDYIVEIDAAEVTLFRNCERSAGNHADVATLAMAHMLGMQLTPTIMRGAAKRNKLTEVQYLCAQGCPWPSELLSDAVDRGQYELLRWCYEHGCPWPHIVAALIQAAASGNVELMAWVLQQPGTEFSRRVMCAAAEKGHTAMCKYLYAKQCPWAICSTCAAARCGNADLLRWLIDYGCPWDAEQLCMAAAASGSVEVLVYLQQLGILGDTETLTYALDDALQHNKLAAAQWLKEQGAEWPTVYYTRHWSSELLTWAVAKGFIPPTN
eukprot:18165-Heterococcus_DN1.PRE.1